MCNFQELTPEPVASIDKRFRVLSRCMGTWHEALKAELASGKLSQEWLTEFIISTGQHMAAIGLGDIAAHDWPMINKDGGNNG